MMDTCNLFPVTYSIQFWELLAGTFHYYFENFGPWQEYQDGIIGEYEVEFIHGLNGFGKVMWTVVKISRVFDLTGFTNNFHTSEINRQLDEI